MHNIYISGENTFHTKEEIKKLVPTHKSFHKFWKFNYHWKAWHLESVADTYITKKYIKTLEEFAKEYDLKIEIVKEPKAIKKSIKDFDSEEEFFEHFHRKNKPYR